MGASADSAAPVLPRPASHPSGGCQEAGFSAAYFNQANRIATATLSFSDGATETVQVKDMFFDQTISFPAHTTSRVKVTFTTVKKGTQYNDLCVSEAYLLP